MSGHIFQGGKVLSITEHDDVAMASYIGEQAIKEGTAFSFDFSEREGDADAYTEQLKADGVLDEFGRPIPFDWTREMLDGGPDPRGGNRSNLDFGQPAGPGPLPDLPGLPSGVPRLF
jgi:hypothetical protein